MSFTRAPPLSAILLRVTRPVSVLNPRRSISCSVVSCLPKPQTPLYLRPANFRATVSDLKKWHLWAKTLASSVGSTFLDLDNGPDSTLLLRELNWLLEDAIENPKPLSSNTDNYRDATDVPLRACLDDLYSMWKQRVEERRPFQYVVGCEHWRDLILGVQEGVLIPRPETEQILDLVDDVLKEDEQLKEGLWADLGTGSGALAIGLARILGPSGIVVAIDLSPVSVAVASANVQRLERMAYKFMYQDKVKVKQGSWFEPLKDEGRELAGLVSNPPYIPSEHISGLQAEVGKHEPKLALDGGANGLDDLLHLCNGAASVLKPGGFFAFETNGEEQSKFLAGYLETESKGVFCNVKIASDFGGVQRFVTGLRTR